MMYHLYDIRGCSIEEDLGGYDTIEEADAFAREYWEETGGECGLLLTHGPITPREHDDGYDFDPVEGWNGW